MFETFLIALPKTAKIISVIVSFNAKFIFNFDEKSTKIVTNYIGCEESEEFELSSTSLESSKIAKNY